MREYRFRKVSISGQKVAKCITHNRYTRDRGTSESSVPQIFLMGHAVDSAIYVSGESLLVLCAATSSYVRVLTKRSGR